LTDEYLEAIDYAYKEIYLPETRYDNRILVCERNDTFLIR